MFRGASCKIQKEVAVKLAHLPAICILLNFLRTLQKQYKISKKKGWPQPPRSTPKSALVFIIFLVQNYNSHY